MSDSPYMCARCGKVDQLQMCVTSTEHWDCTVVGDELKVGTHHIDETFTEVRCDRCNYLIAFHENKI